MRRVLIGLLTTVALVGAGTLAATPAEAAPKPLRITNGTTAWIGWNGTAKVVPKIKKVKGVAVKKKVLTVKQSGKTIGKNRKSVSLRPGTYRVTVKVTYKYKGKTRTVTKKLRVVAKQGACATKADYAKLKVDATFVDEVVGDTVAQASAKLRSKGTGETYTPDQAIEKLNAYRIVLKDMLPEEYWAMVDAFIDPEIDRIEALAANGVTTLEDRSYRGCGDVGVYALFGNGELVMIDNDNNLGSMELLTQGPGAALQSLAH